MNPEQRDAPGGQSSVQPSRPSVSNVTPISREGDPEALRHQIRQTRNEMSDTIDDIERRLDGERLVARAEEVADHVIHEATERAKQVVLEATDHAKEAAKEITDHALAETKLAVREMTGQASAAAREATIGKVENMVHNASERANDAGSSVVDLITRNPIPAALIGVGLGWLLMGNRSGSSATSGRYYPRTGQQVGGRSAWTSESGQPIGEHISELGEKVGEKVGDKFGEAQLAARGAIDQVQETAGTMAEQAQGMAQSAGSTAGDVGSALLDTIQQNPLPTLVAAASLGYLYMNRTGARAPAPIYEARYRAEHAADQLRESTGQIAGDIQGTAGELAGRIQETTGRVSTQAQDTIGELGDSVQSQALRTQYRFEQFFSDRPLVVGAAALTLGMLAGLPVPQTQQEHQLMGEASGKVIDRAQSAVQETAQKLQQAVEQPQGPDEDLRQRANEVAEEAEELAKKLNRPA